MKEKKEIRFIDSRYRELFRIPDGESIVISYPNGQKEERACTFIDEYHTQVGKNVFHICEFAECMERIGAGYQPAKVKRTEPKDRKHPAPERQAQGRGSR